MDFLGDAAGERFHIHPDIEGNWAGLVCLNILEQL